MIGVPSYHAIAAMVITIAMFVAFARGRMSVEIISLLTIAVIAVGLYFFPLPDTKPTDGLSLAFSGFGHYALITICALMIMGRGLVVTGALEPAARFLERLFKVNLQLGLIFSLLVTFVLSMGVNNTPVLVLLMPIFVHLAMRGAMAASKTLIPLNAASLMGGMATTIGTSTNILVVSIAVDLGMPEMGVFHFTPIVLFASLVALPFVWIVMPRMLGDNRIETVHAQRLFETRLRVTENSILNGRELSELESRLPSGIEFHDVPVGLLRPQHRLRMTGTHEAIEEAMATLRGDAAPSWVIDRIRRRSSETGTDIAVGEMIVTADSRLIGRTLPSSGIADLYGVAVIGTHRPDRLVGEKEQFSEGGDHRFAEGDVLLVMGLPDDMQHFARADSLLQLEGMRELPRRSKAALAAGIMGGSIAFASVGLVPIAIASLAGADSDVRNRLRTVRSCRARPVRQRDRAGGSQYRLGPHHSRQRGGGLDRDGHGGRSRLPLSSRCAGGDHAGDDFPDEFRLECHGGNGRHADCLCHSQQAGPASRTVGSGRAVRLQSLLCDAHRLPDQYADHGGRVV